jgi:hypothetical protein
MIKFLSSKGEGRGREGKGGECQKREKHNSKKMLRTSRISSSETSKVFKSCPDMLKSLSIIKCT